jgi:hypothetical protein
MLMFSLVPYTIIGRVRELALFIIGSQIVAHVNLDAQCSITIDAGAARAVRKNFICGFPCEFLRCIFLQGNVNATYLPLQYSADN